MKRMTTNKQTLSEISVTLNERKECYVLGKKVDLNVEHIHNEDKTNPDLIQDFEPLMT
jgi:hypothetical protein